MFEGMLPIGSVVLLKDSEKRVMIIGVLQKQIDKDSEKIWDYSAVLYPEGAMGPDKMFLFDSSQIDKVYAVDIRMKNNLSSRWKLMKSESN